MEGSVGFSVSLNHTKYETLHPARLCTDCRQCAVYHRTRERPISTRGLNAGFWVVGPMRDKHSYPETLNLALLLFIE